MDREKLESLLIDYIDGKLEGPDKDFVEREIVHNPVAKKLYEELGEVMQLMDEVAQVSPAPKLRTSFDAMIRQEIASGSVRRLYPVFYRVAAAVALLVLGVASGIFYSNYRNTQQEVARLESEQRKSAQLAYRMTSTGSVAERITAVRLAAGSGGELNEEIIKALVRTLNEDTNTNVRLAALEALYRFSGEETVRKELVAALGKQEDPLIQITLIQMLVEIKESGVVKPLERIIESEEVLPAVKDEAYKAIMVLS